MERTPESAVAAPQPTVAAPAPSVAGAVPSLASGLSVESVLALQKTAGNQSVARMLQNERTLARYTETNRYEFGAQATGATAFVSHDLEAGTGTYTRTTTRARGNALENQKETYNPDAQAWEAAGGPSFAVRPMLKVSQNGRIAVPIGGQVQVVYLDPALVAESNNRLGQVGSQVRLRTTLLQITFPNGVTGRPGTFTLQETSMVKAPATNSAAALTQVYRLEALNLDATSLANVCHMLAQRVMGTGSEPLTMPAQAARGHGAAAQPDVGQAFHFKTVGAVPDPQLTISSGFSPFFKHEGEFERVMQELAAFDRRLAEVGDGMSMAEALDGGEGLSDAAKAFLPGWSAHSEAVVARDGADALTLANYNRLTEASWIATAAVRRGLQASKPFRQAFRVRFQEFIAAQNERLVAARMDPNLRDDVMPPSTFVDMVGKIGLELAGMLGSMDGAAITRVRESREQIGGNLWYFELYGTGTQSFDAQFQTAATRRLRAGNTTVIGNAAPPVPPPMPPPRNAMAPPAPPG